MFFLLISTIFRLNVLYFVDRFIRPEEFLKISNYQESNILFTTLSSNVSHETFILRVMTEKRKDIAIMLWSISNTDGCQH